MKNSILAIVYDWDDVIIEVAHGYFDPVKKELSVHDTPADKAIYIGDSILDFQSANGAGLQFAGVLTGITDKYKFVNVGVPSSMVIPSIDELPELLQKVS